MNNSNHHHHPRKDELFYLLIFFNTQQEQPNTMMMAIVLYHLNCLHQLLYPGGVSQYGESPVKYIVAMPDDTIVTFDSPTIPEEMAIIICRIKVKTRDAYSG
jgi:hypothetical protein